MSVEARRPALGEMRAGDWLGGRTGFYWSHFVLQVWVRRLFTLCIRDISYDESGDAYTHLTIGRFEIAWRHA